MQTLSGPRPKRILVTGGAGFLGGHLCDVLVAAGHEVLCVDNYFTGTQANVAQHLGRANFELMRHDVTLPLYVEVDEIYNLACPASPIHYQVDPVQTTKTSVHGAINMLGLAKRAEGAGFCKPRLARSTAIPTCTRRPRTYWGNVNPIGPRACYDEGKRCAETLFFDYHRQHRLRHQGRAHLQHLRSAHAPNDGRVVSNFIVQALRGEPLTIYGDGAADAVASATWTTSSMGFMRLMATADEVSGPINLGNPSEATILEMAQMVLDLTGSEFGESSGVPCRRTIRCSAAPTSPARMPNSAGPRKCRSRRG